MSHCCKEEEEESGQHMDTCQKTQNHGHVIRFRFPGIQKYYVTCDSPMTVYERLQTHYIFKGICRKHLQGGKKEVVILREQIKENLRAAVSPNFPCYLLNEDELLDIRFISSGGDRSPVKPLKLTVHSPEHWVSFYIRTRGEKNIRELMNNREVKKNVDYVCVCAVKGESVKAALKRDGRFNKVILRRAALYEQETQDTVILSTLVDHLGGKQFQVTRQDARYQTDSQDSSQEMNQEMNQESETATDEKVKVSETSQATNTNQNSTSTQEKKTQGEEKKCRKYPDTQKIPNTREILQLLREQHGDLLKTLKERENLKNNAEVKKFFREEYDKSAQSFTEVKRVKQLMRLSDSVCQIRRDGSPLGTGFLLFDRFVLTNAHVVGDVELSTRRLTAVFNYEDLDSEVVKIPLEEKVVAHSYETDDMGNHLDFALLELSHKLDVPELLICHTTPPTRGGVCIIGHPDGGVKRMDPCFVIAKKDRDQAASEYYEKNKKPEGEDCKRYNENLHVITQQCLAEDEAIRKSKIFYDTCFFHGSSGSPVFDDQCRLIGVHTGGYVYEGQGKKTRSVMEYALPMFPILLHIYMQSYNSGKSDVVQHFESQNFLPQAKEQLQRNHQ